MRFAKVNYVLINPVKIIFCIKFAFIISKCKLVACCFSKIIRPINTG
jgi:hypothetical protein